MSERQAFAAAWDAGRAQVVVRRLVDDLETPVSAYLKLGLDQPYAFLLESVEGGAWRGRYSVIALKPDLVWRCFGDRAEVARGGDAIAEERFEPEAQPALQSLRALIDASRIDFDQPGLPPMAAGLFGVFGYDVVRLVEPLGPAKDDPLNLPDAVLARPSLVAVFDGVAQEIILACPARPSAVETADQAWDRIQALLDETEAALRAPAPRPAATPPASAQVPLQPSLTLEAYSTNVEAAKDYIRAGDIFQIVPSQRFSAPYQGSPFAFYRSLRRTNPSPFLYFLNFGGFQLAGSSPEILARLRGGKLTLRPIAGTRPRGATPEEDARLEAELLADPKERAEHLMLLDLGRNDVGRIAQPASVRVAESFVIERYAHVMHIVSEVEGQARPDLHPVEVLTATLPAGTLSGAPKVRAMQIIDELETTKRGVGYAGAAGYISAMGEVDLCIVLRTALFADGQIHVQAGGGVVADSDPRAEYDETLHKSRSLRRAAEEAWRFE
ncbi:anthranilate synthase component I [Brevundimonas sp. 2R-24]|uniref:Anthranilate synthase component 1 n=1 Tax=Peiella sedimenti TaxID=3061083 RepID=A0ABT8SIY5_9CAUL|nr:anthranilate synthase component I [Caulobacteraceae bacterium XZ-24]